MRRYYFFLWISVLFFQDVNAQSGLVARMGRDVEHFAQTGVALLRAPFHFDRDDWRYTAASAGITALLFTADRYMREQFQSLDRHAYDKAFFIDDYYGNYYTLALGAGIYGYGLLGGNGKIRRTGLLAMEAFLFSGATTGILKILIGRRRPFAGDSQLFFKPPAFTDDLYQSLPSGHTTVSFAVSTVLAQAVDNGLWKTFWYGGALWVASARMYHNKHWFSDVFLGAAIGYAVGRFVVSQDHRQRLASSRLMPYWAYDSAGIQWKVSF